MEMSTEKSSLEDELRKAIRPGSQYTEAAEAARRERPKAPGPGEVYAQTAPHSGVTFPAKAQAPREQPTYVTVARKLGELRSRLADIENTTERQADIFTGTQPRAGEVYPGRPSEGIFDELSEALDAAHAIVDNIYRNLHRTQSAIE